MSMAKNLGCPTPRRHVARTCPSGPCKRGVLATWNYIAGPMTTPPRQPPPRPPRPPGARPPGPPKPAPSKAAASAKARSEEHTSELQSLAYLVCRLLLEKKKNNTHN